MDTKRASGWRVGLVAAVVSTVVASGLTAAVAGGSFSDTAGHAFESEIGTMANAGCASGFEDGTFRPNQNARRGQFAYWTVNCGGRVNQAYQGNTALGYNSTVNLASTRLETGGAGDGIGYALVQANIQAYTAVPTTCPCRINLQIFEQETSAVSPSRSMTVLGSATATDVFENASLSWLVEVPNNSNRKFVAQAILATSNATTFARSDISVTYLPFLGVQ